MIQSPQKFFINKNQNKLGVIDNEYTNKADSAEMLIQ